MLPDYPPWYDAHIFQFLFTIQAHPTSYNLRPDVQHTIAPCSAGRTPTHNYTQCLGSSTVGWISTGYPGSLDLLGPPREMPGTASPYSFASGLRRITCSSGRDSASCSTKSRQRP